MIDSSSLLWPKIRKVMYWYTGTIRDKGCDDFLIDSLMVLFMENREAVNVDVGHRGDMMIRCDRETGEVIGLEIELFENSFLVKYPELADDWAALKPDDDEGFHNSPWLTGDAAIDYARRLKDIAYQGTQVPGWPAVDRGDILVWSKSDVPA